MRICTVTVRAGSKGVPGKNWRPLLGVPLFGYSVRQAVDSGLFDRVVVTSDAPEVLEHARAFGATDVINRPRELAVDTAGKIPAIVHAVREIEGLLGRDFSTIVDLDATSPLRNNNDIVGAVHLLESRSLESVITGTESRRSPYFNLVEVDPETGVVGLSKRVGDGFLRRQDVPRAFDMNASVYVWARDTFLAEPRVFYPTTQLYEMPPERSQDIDSELDFQIVSWLMQSRER
jgi:N-acylneuraminate cytidylyltransferase/CMP-N,N'-diacetyllegionaminic acid synthase